MAEIIEEGSTFYWKADGIEIQVVDLFVDEDGTPQIRVNDGDNLVSLTAEDIQSRLESGVIVSDKSETLPSW
jgi:hypothetical protein